MRGAQREREADSRCGPGVGVAAVARCSRALKTALAGVKQPVTPAEVAKGFARVNAADTEEILETLCTMGHARRGKAEGTFMR